MLPPWLHILAVVSLITSGGCFVIILSDILLGHPQKMKVMNWVWPITALYMGPFAVWAYYGIGRTKSQSANEQQVASSSPEPHEDRSRREEHFPTAPPSSGGTLERSHVNTAVLGHPDQTKTNQSATTEHQLRHQEKEEDRAKPSWQSVFTGVTHCGAGCTLGDIIGDWIVFAAGWTIAGAALWPKMLGEFICAYLIGIVFQYFSIVPMRHLKPMAGIWAAIKADTLSITAFEVGMFVWMVLSRFVFFHRDLPPTEPVYWFMMQIAMILGFTTSYPMNRWLIKKGWKEAM